MAPTDSPEPKFRRRAEDRPDELLDAALELFLAKGYDATSVAEIARAAGLSKGAVYLYFPSKQAILEGLVQRAVAPISAGAISEAAAAHGDVRAAFTGFARLIASLPNDPRLFAVPRIVIREAVRAPDIAHMYREAVIDAALPKLVALIRAGIDSGQLRPVDPELTVRTIIGPIFIHLMLAEIFDIKPPGKLSLDRLLENHLDILFNGLFAQPETPPDV